MVYYLKLYKVEIELLASLSLFFFYSMLYILANNAAKLCFYGESIAEKAIAGLLDSSRKFVVAAHLEKLKNTYEFSSVARKSRLNKLLWAKRECLVIFIARQ